MSQSEVDRLYKLVLQGKSGPKPADLARLMELRRCPGCDRHFKIACESRLRLCADCAASRCALEIRDGKRPAMRVVAADAS